MSIRFNFLRDALEKELAMLPQKMEAAALEAVDEAADFMVTMAQAYVLVDTGTLQGSIRKEHLGRIVRVSAGGSQFINPKTNRHCDYALFVEHKNPYMRPAWESISKFIEQRIKEKVVEKVNP